MTSDKNKGLFVFLTVTDSLRDHEQVTVCIHTGLFHACCHQFISPGYCSAGSSSVYRDLDSHQCFNHFVVSSYSEQASRFWGFAVGHLPGGREISHIGPA